MSSAVDLNSGAGPQIVEDFLPPASRCLDRSSKQHSVVLLSLTVSSPRHDSELWNTTRWHMLLFYRNFWHRWGFASHHKIGVVVDKSKTSIYPNRVTPHFESRRKIITNGALKYLFNGFKYSDLKPLLISTQNYISAKAMVFKLLRNFCNKTLLSWTNTASVYV